MLTRNSGLVALLLVIAAFVPCIGHAQVPRSSHVVLVIDENTSYSTTVAQMPYLTSLGTANGHATNLKSNTSGSAMDYFWLASGSCHSSASCALPLGTHDFKCTGDGCGLPITDDNIFREMNNQGISWKVYAQSYAVAGGTVTTPDNSNGTHYYRRHNGATWYSDVLSNVAGSQSKVVDFSQFAKDLAADTLPQFSIIAPDGLNDGHDAGAPPADTFLKTNLPALLAKPYFQPGGDGLLVITFDNGDADVAGLVYTALIGPKVTPNTVSNVAYRHENTLRTILDALNIAVHPGATATAAAMTDFFSGYVTITSPAQNSVTTTQVAVSATATEPAGTVDHLEIWENATGVKLAASAPGTSSIQQTVQLAAGTHQLTVQDIAVGTLQVLHNSAVNITVVADGVKVTSPLPNSIQGASVRVVASATESAAQISHLEVWDDSKGQKLGESAIGTSAIDKTFLLLPGTHRLVIEDISAITFQVLHRTAVTVTVLTDGVTINSPLTGSTNAQQVVVNASAHESTATVDHLEVWDDTTGKKLGNGPHGSSTITATYALLPGSHRLIVQDVSTGTFQVLHKAATTITVK